MFGLTTERTAQRRVEEVRASLENPSTPLSDVNAWNALMQEWHSVAGVAVTHESALEVPAVWCAVNFLAGTIAGLPLQLFRKTATGRETADGDPIYGLLHDAPNEELTSFQWRKGMMTSALLWGRGVSFVERNKAGRPMNIWPLDITKLTIERKDGKKLYRYDDNGRKVTYSAGEVIDIPFMLKPDGLTHIDTVSKLKGAVGLALALEGYAQKFFANGGVPPLALYGPMPSPGAASRAATDVQKAVKDANAERRNVMIMPTGHELKPVGVDPQKSQMVEARRMQIEEIARVFDIPPVFLQDLTHGTFSNTEQQDLHYVKHTLTQWLKAWEQELNLKLFSARNRTKYAEFNVDGLLRGDFKTRMEGYRTAAQAGINTPDEIRAMENWPKYDGEGGDKLWMQGATQPLDILVKGPQPQPALGAQQDGNNEEGAPPNEGN